MTLFPQTWQFLWHHIKWLWLFTMFRWKSGRTWSCRHCSGRLNLQMTTRKPVTMISAAVIMKKLTERSSLSIFTATAKIKYYITAMIWGITCFSSSIVAQMIWCNLFQRQLSHIHHRQHDAIICLMQHRRRARQGWYKLWKSDKNNTKKCLVC